MLEKVKPAYFKLVLGVHRNTRNRLVYHSLEPARILVDSFALVETEAYAAFIEEHGQKILHPSSTHPPC